MWWKRRLLLPGFQLNECLRAQLGFLGPQEVTYGESYLRVVLSVDLGFLILLHLSYVGCRARMVACILQARKQLSERNTLAQGRKL